MRYEIWISLLGFNCLVCSCFFYKQQVRVAFLNMSQVPTFSWECEALL